MNNKKFKQQISPILFFLINQANCIYFNLIIQPTLLSPFPPFTFLERDETTTLEFIRWIFLIFFDLFDSRFQTIEGTKEKVRGFPSFFLSSHSFSLSLVFVLFLAFYHLHCACIPSNMFRGVVLCSPESNFCFASPCPECCFKLFFVVVVCNTKAKSRTKEGK